MSKALTKKIEILKAKAELLKKEIEAAGIAAQDEFDNTEDDQESDKLETAMEELGNAEANMDGVIEALKDALG